MIVTVLFNPNLAMHKIILQGMLDTGKARPYHVHMATPCLISVRKGACPEGLEVAETL